MKTLKSTKTIFLSSMVVLMASCMNINDPETSASYTDIATEALTTTESESVIAMADAKINSAIKKSAGQIVTKDDDDEDEDGYPVVKCIGDKDSYPCEYIIDYGEKGHLTRTNHLLKGKLHYTISDKTCKKKEYKSENLSIDGKEIECSRTVEVVSKGVLKFTSEETNKSHEGRNSTYRYAERTRSIIDPKVSTQVGDGDNDLDDYTVYNYSIDVYIKGVNAKGQSYSMKTVEPLITDFNKKGFVKGIMSVTTKKGKKYLDLSKEGKNKEVEYKEKESDSHDNNSDNGNKNSENNNSENNSNKNSKD